MIELTLIGIGTGNPDHVTMQAVKAMNAAELILIPLKGADKADLAGLRQEICRSCITNPSTRIASFDLPERDPAIPDYLARVNDWHDEIAALWLASIRANLPWGGGKVAFLVWGDPSLYDSTLRIAERLALQMPLRLTVIPGMVAFVAALVVRSYPLDDAALADMQQTLAQRRAQHA